ncbi:MAG: hypothetical protein A2W90_06350 [Bacteroidetes bacterium GWF2_42_66]|nr:MAG: hypothetical protein A2W92_20860 [Bacteroidetes bacterium GWA2_42_15]OFX99635.1 MAG: hypothetical protein A2W89_00405 [Bacteroidetes bacterium GWE2_42_39]OFY39546.1 MAG: hypothetical protein A2W90_06350 [Bacteroidetes bacterium GWF2_42_66]HBL73615.1 hypothetical protein [Prolixibacteraceae bacterium]HCU63879.1 hypothetical protein [Prolixibacteraceae bacterium]
MDENLLLRILTDEASLEEQKDFYRKLKDNQEEEKLFYEIKSLWLRTSMHKTVVDVDSDFEILWRKIKQSKKQTTYTLARQIMRYAAIILVVLGFGGAAGYFISQNTFEYNDYGTQKFISRKGSVSIVELSDGTKVWLNSGTELTYKEDHKNKKRFAELNGEAYFEVTHRDDFPLIVKTGQIIIRDLGTTFNIKAYPEDNYIETSLVEGDVDILSENGKSLVALTPGESAMYFPKEKKMELRSISNNVLSAWRDGKFVIRDQRLEDIFTELSRWYDVEFRFEDEKLRDYRFTGNIKKSTTARHVLEMLKLTADFHYRILEKNTGPDMIVIY